MSTGPWAAEAKASVVAGLGTPLASGNMIHMQTRE